MHADNEALKGGRHGALGHGKIEQDERSETRKYSASLKLYRWIAKSTTTAKMVIMQ